MAANIYTVDEIRQIMKELSNKYDIRNAYLFGSYARGEATEKSDIDIVILPPFIDGIKKIYEKM